MKIAAVGSFFSDEAWAGFAEQHRGQPIVILTGSMEEVREVGALFGQGVKVVELDTNNDPST
ncbi:hypothetical protein [Labilithrix luteola]|nr:hypothetical protein [Labilithrix luteola]